MPKPALVMIHGLVGSLNYFAPEQRISGATVHTCDLLGYGRWQDTAPKDLTLATQLDHVARFIAGLNEQRPVWVLGHSMGGAIAMLLASRHPELVRGVINVEGNFTLDDAFWSSRIVAMPLKDWEADYGTMCSDVPTWLAKCGIAATAQRSGWAEQILAWQPARTVYAMSHALVEETGDPAYLRTVRAAIDRGITLDLIAGEKSAEAWDVPAFVRRAARSHTEQEGAGHLMMLESPGEFCRIVDACLCEPTVTQL